MSDRVPTLCSACGAETRGDLHTLEDCVTFLRGRVGALEGELAHVHWMLLELKHDGWSGACRYVVSDAEEWLRRAGYLLPREACWRRSELRERSDERFSG